VRARGGELPSAPETRAALARQITAVDSARSAGKRPRKTRKPKPARGGRSATARAPGAAAGDDSAHVVHVVVDLDAADSAAIEQLPRIGPTLARRIVADRDSNGAFGSIAGLERVRGIGPAVAKRVAPHVTFSGTPRPTSAVLSRTGAALRRDRRRQSSGPDRRPVLLAPSPRAHPITGAPAFGVASP
jgi:competence protein ComEA